MVALVRDFPVKWFVNVPALLDRIDRFETLVETINASRIRTNARMATMIVPQVNASAPPLAKAIGKTYVAHFEAVRQQRVSSSQLILSAAVLTTWIGAKAHAVEVLSLGDLIDGSHGRSIVTQKAAQELENISRISGVPVRKLRRRSTLFCAWSGRSA